MNYNRIYSSIIDRARQRISHKNEYYERHHIIPKCMGGSDDENNIVLLTGREHYIAHLCLMKIYPEHGSLVKAAAMMCVSNNHSSRSKNRLYEWLRKKLAKENKLSQTGIGNSQYGKVWIFNEILEDEMKIEVSELEQHLEFGWKKGRLSTKKLQCLECGILFYPKKYESLCSEECQDRYFTKVFPNPFHGREQELLELYKKTGSLNKAIKEMGFLGAIGNYYYQAKKIIMS